MVLKVIRLETEKDNESGRVSTEYYSGNKIRIAGNSVFVDKEAVLIDNIDAVNQDGTDVTLSVLNVFLMNENGKTIEVIR